MRAETTARAAYKEVCGRNLGARGVEGSPAVADVVFLAILVAFFCIAVGFVHLCERIVGPDMQADTPVGATESEPIAA
jgi:hypothetical protein